MTAVIRLNYHPPFVHLRPVEFLGPERFLEYRRAVAGASFDKATKTYRIGVEKVEDVLKQLQVAGFDVDPSGDLVREVLMLRTTRWNDLGAANDRITHIDAQIREASGGKRHMYGYQMTAARWLSTLHAALLADEQGLGKTLESLASLPSNAPVLVVCPNSLKDNWVKEVRLWRPHLRPEVLTGRTAFRWPAPNEVLIVNAEALPAVHGKRADGSECDGTVPQPPCAGCFVGDDGRATRGKHKPSCCDGCLVKGSAVVRGRHKPRCKGRLAQRIVYCEGCHPFLDRAPEGLVAVVDEAHRYKNPATRQSQCVRAICRAARLKRGRNQLLTGTPIVNRAPELWAVLQLADLARTAFGSYDDFIRLFNGERKPRGGILWGAPEPEVPELMRKVSMRRMRRDVLELPDKVRGRVHVELDPATIKACDRFLHEQGKTAEEVAELLATEKIPFQLISLVRSALASAKIPAMLEFVEEAEEREAPLLVFSCFRPPVEELATRPGWLVVHGEIPVKERQKAVDRFQLSVEECRRLGLEPLKGLALTIETGAFGYTLTRATEELFVDRDPRPGTMAQCEDRAMRIGQVNKLLITDIVAGHALDARMLEINLEKMALIEATVDASSAREDVRSDVFEERLRALAEEVTLGRAVRRQVETDEDRSVLRDLGRSAFEDADDERTSRDLVEESALMGLTDAQWRLARALARRGRRSS